MYVYNEIVSMYISYMYDEIKTKIYIYIKDKINKIYSPLFLNLDGMHSLFFFFQIMWRIDFNIRQNKTSNFVLNKTKKKK